MKLTDLLEELQPSQYREYVKGWDKSRYKDIFQKYTDNPKAYRIYLPFKGKPKKDINVPKIVDNILYAMGYIVSSDSYVNGLAFRRANPEPSKVYKIGRLIQDIIDRGANDKNTDKLNMMNRLALEYAGEDPWDRGDESKEMKGDIKTFAQDALKAFNNDPQRAATKDEDYYIVISRHPYDIAGMSTNRGWTSCMNLDDGCYHEIVAHDVDLGTLVAYLVKLNDKNINNPVGRVLIKPFFNTQNPKEIAFGVEGKVYGTNVDGFQKRVVQWADEVNESKNLDGMFEFNRNLYSDHMPQSKYVGKNQLKKGDVIEVDTVELNRAWRRHFSPIMQIVKKDDDEVYIIQPYDEKTDKTYGDPYMLHGKSLYRALKKVIKRA